MIHRLAFIPFALLAGCTTPDVAPAVDIAAPAAAQPDVSPAEVELAEAPPTPEPAPQPTPAAPSPAPTIATPWGAPLELTGKSHGLRFTTTAQVLRSGTALQLALDVTLHNPTRAPLPVSRHPPLVMVMAAPAPGSTGEGLGLGMRGEGMGSDACSHGGPLILRPGDRTTLPRKLVDLDPLPWPPGQAQRVTASSRDCRPDRLTFGVVDVTVLQPASPDGVPTLVATAPARAR